MNNYLVDYGVKYKAFKISDERNEYLLFPISVLNGYEAEDKFYTKDSSYDILSCSYDINDKGEIVDKIYSIDDLKILYDIDEDFFDDDDYSFLIDYYYEDVKDVVFYVNLLPEKIVKKELDLNLLRKLDYIDTYVMLDDLPSVVLNDNSLTRLLECDDLKILKEKLRAYKSLVAELKKENEEKAVTRIEVLDGSVRKVETKSSLDVKHSNKNREFSSKNDVSYSGLKNYIKERVFGHDEEIDIIAKILYMNYTALADEKVDSVMLSGPTGTGKTETFNAAMDYLGLPMVTVNTSNLVPQGIVGTSLEDVLYSLYSRANRNMSFAEKGIVFLDEYDKLPEMKSDYKSDIKNILLTFNAGGEFNISGSGPSGTSNLIIDTSRLTKVYAGVFNDIYTKNKKTMGFVKNVKEDNITDVKSALLDKGYFSLEELSRIKYILNYTELSNEVKKKILKESKLSEYFIKKSRYKRQFGVDLLLTDEYMDALFEKISSPSMREVNNMVSSSLDFAEMDMIQGNNEGKKLILTKDTVFNPRNYILK